MAFTPCFVYLRLISKTIHKTSHIGFSIVNSPRFLSQHHKSLYYLQSSI